MINVIHYILSPPFLANRIGIISYIVSAAILVIFSDLVFRNIIFPIADIIRDKTQSKLGDIKKNKKKGVFVKYLSEALSTAIFLVYCWMGSNLLSEYIIAPILTRWRNFILITVIILFCLVSIAINSEKWRKAFFDCWKYK
jgi:nucleoside permease NupC